MRLRTLLAVLVAGGAVLLFAACSSGSSSKAKDAGDPLDALRSMIDAMNRVDVSFVFDHLSTEAKASLTPRQLAALLDEFTTRGRGVHITIDAVGERAQTADKAQISLTLGIDFNGVHLPLKDVAVLVVEDNQWKLSDHFIQNALVVVGGATPVPATRTFDANGCVVGDMMAGVYIPSRLKVLDPCTTVEGIVRHVDPVAAGEGDGDLTFDIEVSGDDQRLLNDVNRQAVGGFLHIEIIPMDQDRLPKPRVGQRVRVRGPWVTDLVHGHNEIHPAWSLEILN